MHGSNIAVTGIGCITALGSSIDQSMDNLFLEKVNCTSSPRHLWIDHPDQFPVFEIDDDQLRFDSRYNDIGRSAQLSLIAAIQATKESGLKAGSQKRVGVCIGTTVGNSFNIEHLYSQFRDKLSPDTFELERYFRSNPAEFVANYFKATGPVMAVANACSSGTDALGLAMSWLNQDFCDIVIAGGVDELNHISYLGFSSLLINTPKPPKPFDKERTGLNLGEGAAVLVLEKNCDQERAKAFVERYATACDQFHPTAPHPDGKGLRETLKRLAGDIHAGEVAFINAHGTGTGENDRVEMRVLADMYPETDYFSVKGATGHTLGAAGAIEAAVTVACFERNMIPPSVGFTTTDPEFDHPPTQSAKQLEEGCYAISQSLAFGGNNSALLFRRK